MGTEFEVNVADADHSTVRVDQGRVSILPLQGSELSVRKGQRAILNPTQTIVEESPKPQTDDDAKNLRLTEPQKPKDTIRCEYQPVREPIPLKSDLAGFIHPVPINLEPGIPEGRLKKAPAFTSESPLFGLVRARVEERPLEMPVVCDQKLNGKSKISFDSNANGDLTDDPAFTEGEDFVVGKPFPVNLSRTNNMIWLSRPIQVDTKSNPPRVAPVEDRLDYYNAISLSGEVSIPRSPSDSQKVNSVSACWT